jgi:hypothetical protein
MKLTARWRKTLLTAHLATSAGWLGVSGVLLTLSVAGMRGADPAVIYPAIALVGQNLLVPLAVAAWALGILTSLLTPWGLVKHWWVLVKLVLTTILAGLVVFLLWPSLREIPAPGFVVTPAFQEQLLAPPIVQTTALLGITLISVFKPWGRTKRRQTAKPAVRASRAAAMAGRSRAST